MIANCITSAVASVESLVNRERFANGSNAMMMSNGSKGGWKLSIVFIVS